VHFYISINKFDLKLKILHQIDGLEFNSVNSEIIGSYSSKFVCKIIEKKL